MRIFLSLLTLLLLTACASVPKDITGSYSDVGPRRALAEKITGERVRWGGEIIKVDPQEKETCFEVLSRDLTSDARPIHRDHSEGRFLACREGFYDPALFTEGREITVTGTISGTETRLVGGYDYTYPVVHADAVHLWSKREMYARGYYEPWPGYYYDPFWYGWWGSPVIVVHRHHAPPPPPPPPRR